MIIYGCWTKVCLKIPIFCDLNKLFKTCEISVDNVCGTSKLLYVCMVKISEISGIVLHAKEWIEHTGGERVTVG